MFFYYTIINIFTSGMSKFNQILPRNISRLFLGTEFKS